MLTGDRVTIVADGGGCQQISTDGHFQVRYAAAQAAHTATWLRTKRPGWSSLNRSGQPCPELLMRLGFQRFRPIGGRTPHQLRQHLDASCGPVALEALDLLETESRVKTK